MDTSIELTELGWMLLIEFIHPSIRPPLTLPYLTMRTKRHHERICA